MAGNSGQAGRRYSSTRPSLCYPSLNTQAAFRPALLSCCKLISVFPNADSDRLRVILVATRNPLNIGAAARAMSNFGFQHLRVVNPYELAFREAKSAVGAAPLLRNAEEYTSLGDAVGDCSLVVGTTAARNRELRHALHPLTAGAALVSQAVTRERVGLLFGSEKRGLSNEDLSHCQWLMRIPTEEKHPSMNLGQAVAVCLYEIVRDRESPARPQVEKAATAKDLGRIEGSLMQAL